jgi:hypothetical protein
LKSVGDKVGIDGRESGEWCYDLHFGVFWFVFKDLKVEVLQRFF